jgi:uncharacterized metal-binding protein YceD (DUF177 family)
MTDDLPFSRPIGALSLPAKGTRIPLQPSASERAAIAAFLALPSLESFEGEVELVPARGGVHVTGSIKASVHQTCVVSLEAFPGVIEETIDAHFAPQDKLGTVSRREVERTFDEEEPPEPIVGGMIDVGMLAVEALSLGLDPFPRKPGVEMPESAISDVKESPFAALAALKTPPTG